MFLTQDKKWLESAKTIHAFIDRHVSRALKATESEKQLSPQASQQHRYILLDEMANLTKDPLELGH